MPTTLRCDGSSQKTRISLIFVHASVLTVALLPGCVSSARPRSQSATMTPESPPPFESVRDQAKSDLPKRRGRSKPQTPPLGEPKEGDVGLALTAAQAPSDIATGISTPAVPPAEQEFPIDLTTSLRLAEVENPLIAEARQRIGEALAVQQGARALLLPSLNVGTNYHSHTGDLQRSSGRILSLTEKSLYFGGGAGALAAGTVEVPAVSIFSPLTDAIFEPLAARQQVEGARFTASATANNILLEVAELHFELLAAEASVRVRQESATQAAEVARLTRAYAQAQQGREADAERGATELSLIVDEVRQAEEDLAVASARLTHRLHLDQTVRLKPIGVVFDKVTIVDPERPLEELIQAALQRRPEVGARSAAIEAAELRRKQELFRPLLPTVWLGFSGGAFGGGSNLLGPELAHFGGRTDFDVMAFWTLQNFGIGNLSLQKQRAAQAGQAVGERSRVIARIRSEVSAAYAESAAARQQVDITTRQLASAESGFREDLERIRNTVARPIEVVNGLRLLNQARVARIRAVTDYNKAEIRLFVALGSPPPLGESANAPIPPAPIATPPVRMPALAGSAGLH
jgi:outer membrane protein TolC